MKRKTEKNEKSAFEPIYGKIYAKIFLVYKTGKEITVKFHSEKKLNIFIQKIENSSKIAWYDLIY